MCTANKKLITLGLKDVLTGFKWFSFYVACAVLFKVVLSSSYVSDSADPDVI